jgi:hypothetical protein
MPDTFYFGTRNHMSLLPYPDVNMAAGKTGSVSSSQYLNGGASIRRSVGGHKRYSLTWRLNRQDALQPILDYADGMYGDLPIYFLDPFAMPRNLLNQMWSLPATAGYGVPPLIGSKPPLIVPTAANTYGYPSETALYTDFTGEARSIYIPIQPGHILYIGAHGSASGSAALQVKAFYTSGAVATSNVPLLPVTTDTRVVASYGWFPSTTTKGIELSLARGAMGTLSLSGIMVQSFPTGVTPPMGNFIAGRGHGGVRFASAPSLSQYNATIDRIGVAAEMWEVEPWR